MRMHLLLRGQTIPVAQMGPDFLLVDSPTDHAPGDAQLVLRVDQSERQWTVRLPNGVSARSKRVLLAAVA